jgi:hypothetical protein
MTMGIIQHYIKRILMIYLIYNYYDCSVDIDLGCRMEDGRILFLFSHGTETFPFSKTSEVSVVLKKPISHGATCVYSGIKMAWG